MDIKQKVYKWLEEGIPKVEIARRLNLPASTFKYRLDTWVNREGFVIPKKVEKPITPREAKEAIKDDRKIQGLTEKEKFTKWKYKTLLKDFNVLEKQITAVKALRRKPKPFVIKKSVSSGKNEATLIALFSDWHIEEEVTLEQTSNLNEYNLAISEKRAKQCFSRLLRLVEIENKNVPIKNVVIGLLGDFISSDIHEDTSKSALLEPSHAIVRARNYIHSGIKYMLENSELNLQVVCHTGNHGRKDKMQLIANEAGNSLEYLMYHFLAGDFANEPRVEFRIPEGYHSYLDVYGTIVRFHHGHAIRYGGGVGGITIPVNKAIAGWNEGRKADIDCFGHFHQALDGELFIANGSMIGYNAFALYIKARYQAPKQMVFGIHSKLGKYVTRPILFE